MQLPEVPECKESTPFTPSSHKNVAKKFVRTASRTTTTNNNRTSNHEIDLLHAHRARGGDQDVLVGGRNSGTCSVSFRVLALLGVGILHDGTRQRSLSFSLCCVALCSDSSSTVSFVSIPRPPARSKRLLACFTTYCRLNCSSAY